MSSFKCRSRIRHRQQSESSQAQEQERDQQEDASLWRSLSSFHGQCPLLILGKSPSPLSSLDLLSNTRRSVGHCSTLCQSVYATVLQNVNKVSELDGVFRSSWFQIRPLSESRLIATARSAEGCQSLLRMQIVVCHSFFVTGPSSYIACHLSLFTHRPSFVRGTARHQIYHTECHPSFPPLRCGLCDPSHPN